jgi:mRNA capping enzyme
MFNVKSNSNNTNNSNFNFYDKATLAKKDHSITERSKGPSYPLKRFHNSVKMALYEKYASSGDRHLELCAGRGGDLFKLISLNKRTITLVDSSRDSLLEAERRYRESCRESSNISTSSTDSNTNGQIHFVVSDLGSKPIPCIDELIKGVCETSNTLYDSASCMFALNYFAQNRTKLETILVTAYENLNVGGYFFGIYLQGESVVRTMNGQNKIHTGLLDLEIFPRKRNSCSSSVRMSISDTIVEQQDDLFVEEYLLHEKLLNEMALRVGFVVKQVDEKLHGYVQPKTQSLFPVYPPQTDPSLFITSRMYSIFVFQKK